MISQSIARLFFAGILMGGMTLASESPANQEKQFLYRIQPQRVDMLRIGPTQEESAILAENFNYLKDITAKGVVIFAGRTLTTDESTFGIVVFRAKTEEAARKIMENDPAVKKGVMRAKLFPFRVVLMGHSAAQ